MENKVENNNSAEFTSLETNDDNQVAVTDKEIPDIKVLKRKIEILEKENESFKRGKDSFEEAVIGLKSQIKDLGERRDAYKKERNSLIEENAEFKNKFMTVTSKLRDQIECPVCLEVPTSGPVFCCPNGHFVCSKCKDTNCPTCRSKMFNGKSLLAVTVIENIEHKCKNDGCEKEFHLAEYELHMNSCPHRLVSCPAPNPFCTKKVALSKLYEHILTQCKGSLNKTKNKNLNDGIYPKQLSNWSKKVDIPIVSGTQRGLCLKFDEVKFYLNVEKGAGYAVFSVQLLENAEKCKDYEVMIAVHRTDDKDMKGKYVQRLVWEPFPVDLGEEERKMNGLMVGFKMLEKIVVKEGDKWKFSITVDFKKVR